MSALLSWDRIMGTQSWGRSNCPSVPTGPTGSRFSD
jgi:hypothetical protein